MSTNINELEIPHGFTLGLTMEECKQCGKLTNHVFLRGGQNEKDHMVCEKCREDESKNEEEFGF